MRYVNRDNHDKTRRWAARLKDKAGMNKAVVAVAHKKAKICYAVLRDGTVYKENNSIIGNTFGKLEAVSRLNIFDSYRGT
jgi:hypothetical protein